MALMSRPRIQIHATTGNEQERSLLGMCPTLIKFKPSLVLVLQLNNVTQFLFYQFYVALMNLCPFVFLLAWWVRMRWSKTGPNRVSSLRLVIIRKQHLSPGLPESRGVTSTPDIPVRSPYEGSTGSRQETRTNRFSSSGRSCQKSN